MNNYKDILPKISLLTKSEIKLLILLSNEEKAATKVRGKDQLLDRLGVSFIEPLSNDDLAKVVGVSTRTISRSLRKLEREGYIICRYGNSLRYRHIHVLEGLR